MANFYTDHPEIKFNLESSPLMQRIVELKENGYADKDNASDQHFFSEDFFQCSYAGCGGGQSWPVSRKGRA